MTHQIFFIRHGKVDLPYKSHAEMPFKILCELGSGQLNPSIDLIFTQNLVDNFIKELPESDCISVIASPSQRCQDTAKLLSENIENRMGKKTLVTICDALKEVHFDLKKLYPEALPEEVIDISDLNFRVLSGMISGEVEPIDLAKARVEEAFSSINKQPSGIVICVAHDFILRVIQLAIKNNGTQNLLETKVNGYLQGFKTDSNFQTFKIIE